MKVEPNLMDIIIWEKVAKETKKDKIENGVHVERKWQWRQQQQESMGAVKGMRVERWRERLTGEVYIATRCQTNEGSLLLLLSNLFMTLTLTVYPHLP
ncbi:hypothetical protein Nepgr_024179 [Nepenthes gracilis]|uniref:Uncharacterized protein n=1 Tax=Nepenthes gracilis TaxID=150966 RepID=A0AAD3Y081_NEPGR|nr:hypothetical protein Nepgr_024179 [Nepenthes gracilis]